MYWKLIENFSPLSQPPYRNSVPSLVHMTARYPTRADDDGHLERNRINHYVDPSSPLCCLFIHMCAESAKWRFFIL